jgi:hypothetical protein
MVVRSIGSVTRAVVVSSEYTMYLFDVPNKKATHVRTWMAHKTEDEQSRS